MSDSSVTAEVNNTHDLARFIIKLKFFPSTGKKAETPYIDYTELLGGSVELNHQVELKCATRDATIYYTIDGSAPYPWHRSSQVVLPHLSICYYASAVRLESSVAAFNQND